MTEEPKSINELAQLLCAERRDGDEITINDGYLTFKSTQPFRQLVNSERFADCLSIAALAWKIDQEALAYRIQYKISRHHYQDNSEPDIGEIFKSVSEAATLISLEPETYKDFKRMINFKEYLVNVGLGALKDSIQAEIAKQELWDNIHPDDNER